MTPQYELFRTRVHALNEVVDRLESWQRPDLPWDDRLAEVFGTREDLLRAVHASWHRKLTVRLEPLVERGATVEEAVREWRQLAAETPGVRALLEAHSAALQDACRREDFALACAAGLAAQGDDQDRGARAWRAALGTGRQRSTWDSWCFWRRPVTRPRVGATA